MKQAAVIIGDDAATAPEFMAQLNESLRNAPRYPQQIILPFEGCDDEPTPPEKNNQTPRFPKPIPSLPPATQLRIEIWRE